ncbi:FkbM family methyltransferase [Gammaproteobacteria bacterium]|nr:FkbM family methyltransferase [Gammaproteobacteria bacterium]MDC1484768.1 FkbM family methyltransferase [Gammaproteobacteria bacterium]|tara:strand:- start:147 stop:1022 length:876 start_codon:yes stop_codon:yes gene_type:complete
MKKFLKLLIIFLIKQIILFAPQKNMASHLYRIKLFVLVQFQKIMMQRVRTETYKGHMLKFTVPSYLSDWRAQTFTTKEPETLDWIDSMVDGCILWDVGANIGVYSLYAAQCKDAKVFAFEPSLFNLELLARNIYLNNLHENIAIAPIALSDKTNFGSIKMTSTEMGSALATFGEDFGWDGQKIKHNFTFKTIGMTMDDAASYLQIPLPNYIKIDVDGLEHLILLGGQKVLAQVDEVLIEVNDDFIQQAEGVSKALTNCGLTLVDKRHSPEEFSDGLDVQANSAFNQIWKRI